MTPTPDSPEARAEQEARLAVLVGIANGLRQLGHDATVMGLESKSLDAYAAAIASRVRAETLAEVRRVVEGEEELDGRMPDHINTALTFGPREARAEILRSVVRTTKRNVLAALDRMGP